MEVILLVFDQPIKELLILIEKFLILVRNKKLKLFRKLHLVDIHPNLYTLGVALLVEILIVTTQKREI